MIQPLLLNAITIKSSTIGRELNGINTYLILDPDVAVIKARKVLELIINEIDSIEGSNLVEKIQSLNSEIPDSVITYMHFIRRIGNSAAHSDEKISKETATNVQNMLLDLVCWHFCIDPNNLDSAKARFFIADSIYQTWSKIAVLTSDGVLYSEYLCFNQLKRFKKTGLCFTKFKSEDYKFGEEEHGHAYQPIREVNYQEAVSFQLTRQGNWVDQYLKRSGVENV